MRQKIVLALLAAVALAVALYFVGGQALAPSCGYKLDPYPEHNLLAVLAGDVDAGKRINTAGFVLYRYTCPECPAGATCDACMPNTIVIGNELDDVVSFVDVDPDRHLLIEVPDVEAFRKDNRYLFSVAPRPDGQEGPRRAELFACARAP